MLKTFLIVLSFVLSLAAPVTAQVVHDASSEAQTGSTPSTSVASFSWSHGGAASNVKGVLVFTISPNSSADNASAVTYGGTNVPAVTGAVAADTVGEPGRVKAWFLGSSVPQGTQTVEVTRTNNTDQVYAVAITVTAGANTEIYEPGIVLVQENAIPAEQNVTDNSPGTNSVRYAAAFYGGGVGSAAVAGANSTLLQNIQLSSQQGITVQETTAGQGSRPVGVTAATDDFAAVYLAVRQVSTSTPKRLLLMGIGG